VEAVQTCDLPLLFEHVHFVLERAAPPPNGNFDRTQEAFVLRYIAHVLERMEKVGEKKIMDQVEHHQIVPLVLSHLHRYHRELSDDDTFAGCRFLSMAIDTDAFDTSPAAFLDGPARDQLRDFPALFLDGLTGARESKSKLRPLLDQLARS